jgi:hypothetical protein
MFLKPEITSVALNVSLILLLNGIVIHVEHRCSSETLTVSLYCFCNKSVTTDMKTDKMTHSLSVKKSKGITSQSLILPTEYQMIFSNTNCRPPAQESLSNEIDCAEQFLFQLPQMTSSPLFCCYSPLVVTCNAYICVHSHQSQHKVFLRVTLKLNA